MLKENISQQSEPPKVSPQQVEISDIAIIGRVDEAERTKQEHSQ